MYSFIFFLAGKALEVSKKHLEQLSELDELQALGKFMENVLHLNLFPGPMFSCLKWASARKNQTMLHANSKGSRPACALPQSDQRLCDNYHI